VNDDGSYSLLIKDAKDSKILDATYTDKVTYNAAYIDILNPVDTDGSKKATEGEMTAIFDNIMGGVPIREAVSGL